MASGLARRRASTNAFLVCVEPKKKELEEEAELGKLPTYHVPDLMLNFPFINYWWWHHWKHMVGVGSLSLAASDNVARFLVWKDMFFSRLKNEVVTLSRSLNFKRPAFSSKMHLKITVGLKCSNKMQKS